MAIYTIQIKTVSRSNGHSATAKIAYNCRDKITDLRTNQIHKYNNKKMSSDLVYSEITYKDLTIDKKHRSEIWNNAELVENRKDSRTAREYVIALPKELNTEQNIKLVREFAEMLTTKYNNIADWAIHNEKDGNGNIHAHVLTTTREFNYETKQLGERVAIEWNNTKCQKNNVPITQEQIKNIRKDWEIIQNKHLALAGLDLTVSCERKEDRETVKKHLGKNASSLERKGIETSLGDYNRTIDNAIELKEQVCNNVCAITKNHAELEMLELQKQKIEKQRKQNEHQELMRLEKLQKEQEEITKLKIPANNYVTAKNRYALFEIAKEHKEFFTKQTKGNYYYWTSRNNEIDVHKTHVNINKVSDNSTKLALDIAITQFGNNLNIRGSNTFVDTAINILASDPQYKNISLDNPKYQEMLESKRLDIEIENAPDLDLSDELNIELKPQNKFNFSR